MALAAAVSNLTLEWVDGVDGDTVEERVLPPGERPRHKSSDVAVRGSWRAHMNALHRVVEEGLPSTLIMEDDVDWDLRVKSQLQTFGAASRAWLQTSRGMVAQSPGVLNEEDRPVIYWSRRRGVGIRGASTADHEAGGRHSILLDQVSTANDPTSADHPYGKGWDVLWLGHCGTDFPDADATTLPPLRVVVPDDPSVPAPQHLKPHPFASHDALGELYPPHTRVVHAAASPRTACTLAYAVSQRGARKLLWQFGLEDFSSQWDLMLGNWCAGGYVNGEGDGDGSEDNDTDTTDRRDDVGIETDSEAGAGAARGSRDSKERSERRRQPRQQPTCLTVQPPIFGHYFAKKGASDIRGQGGGYVSKVGTPYVRWSVRLNLDVLTEGGSAADVVDQLPDGSEARW